MRNSSPVWATLRVSHSCGSSRQVHMKHFWILGGVRSHRDLWNYYKKIVHGSKLWKCIAVHGRNLLLTLIMQLEYFSCHPFRVLPASVKQPAITTHAKYTGPLENRSEEAWKASNPSFSWEQEQLWDQSRLLRTFPSKTLKFPKAAQPLWMAPLTCLHSGFSLNPHEPLVSTAACRLSLSSHTLWRRVWLHLLGKHLPRHRGLLFGPPKPPLWAEPAQVPQPPPQLILGVPG